MLPGKLQPALLLFLFENIFKIPFGSSNIKQVISISRSALGAQNYFGNLTLMSIKNSVSICVAADVCE